jgi:hypothetical protein
VSLSAVNACLRTRRQHPPDHQRQGKKVIPDPATKSPTLGDPINVTGRAPGSSGVGQMLSYACPTIGFAEATFRSSAPT